MKSKRKPPVLRRMKKKTGEVDAAALIEAGKATQFKPGGPSPNPGGRPRSLASQLSQELRRLLRSECPKDATQRSWAEALAEKMCHLALEGDVHAFSEIADRTEGRPAQAIQMSGSLDLGGMTQEEIEQKIKELIARAHARAAARNGAEQPQQIAN
jgi:hypothetical protein